MSNTIKEALQAFPRWMNRPLARVHVYSWRLAVLLEPSASPGKLGKLMTIRYVPAHRSPECLFWRKTVAAAIRIARRSGKITLPRYDERSGQYV